MLICTRLSHPPGWGISASIFSGFDKMTRRKANYEATLKKTYRSNHQKVTEQTNGKLCLLQNQHEIK